MLRVITQKKPFTRNKDDVLKNLDMDMIAAHASRKSARLCEEGDYESARANIYSNALWMNRHSMNATHSASATHFVHENMHIDSAMQQQQHQEKDTRTSYVSKSRQKSERSRQRGDVFSANMYSNKQI